MKRVWMAFAVVIGLVLGAVAPASAQASSDALRVTLCGTSGPLPVRDRAKPCVMVQAGDAVYLVDVGPEATENLQRWQIPLAAARAVFVTHLHSDHIGEVGEFNLQSWVAGRAAPLVLVGPPGIQRVAAGFNEAYGPDHGFRQAHHNRDGVPFDLSAGLLKAKSVAAPPSGTVEVWNEGGLKVTAIVVSHEPATPAYAYRFDFKGRSVVVSGDTRKSPQLAEAAGGADVLIHEAQNAEMVHQMSQALLAAGRARMSSVIGDTLTYHSTPVDAADVARGAGVKVLILTHLTQAGLPFFTPEAFARGIEAGGALDWRLGVDGMTLELPTDSSEIRFSQR